MTPIDDDQLRRMLGADEGCATRMLEGAGIRYERVWSSEAGPQGYPLGSRPRVLWAALDEPGDRVILYLALPQAESPGVQAAKERHFGTEPGATEG